MLQCTGQIGLVFDPRIGTVHAACYAGFIDATVATRLAVGGELARTFDCALYPSAIL